MPEWNRVQLGDLCDSERGITYGIVKVGDYIPGGVPVIRGGDIRDNKIVFDDKKRVSPEISNQFRRTILQGGEIVLNLIAEPGHSAVVPSAMTGFNVSRDVAVIPLSGQANHLFVNYFLKSPAAVSWLEARLNGSVTQKINLGVLREIPVPLPSRSYQDAIAEILGGLDDKITIDGRTTETYEKLLSAQFDELHIDIDPEPSSAITTSQLIDFNPTLRIPRGSDAVYLDMAAVPTDRAMVSEWSKREPKSGTRFSNGDTVMARITPCLENGKTAFIDFMKKDEIGIGSTEFIVMRARPGTPIELPYFLARSPRFRSYAIQNMVGSSGRQRVDATQLVDFPLSRPDSENLSAFGADASKAFAHMRSLADESRNLAELRDALLPKLMSGEVRVRDAEKVVEDVT